MNNSNVFALSVSLLLMLGPAAFGQQVTQNQVLLVTPSAPWSIRLDGRELGISQAQIKPDGRSGYFLMEDAGTGMTISFFVEPVDKCKTSDECRDHVLNVGNPAWGKYQDLAKGKVGAFSYFEFFRPVVMNQPIQIFDMYAEYVADGFWIDLHISKVEYRKEQHALFEDFAKSVKLVANAGSTVDADKLHGKVETTARTWFQLWDAGKCPETYRSLTSISRSAVKEGEWVGYCSAAQKSLGKMKSRQLVASSLIKSIRGKPELSGATLHFQSLFEIRPQSEFVSLTVEKDGTWTVSNYLSR